EDGPVVVECGVEEEDRWNRRGVRFALEAGENGPEDREEDDERNDVREEVQSERCGLEPFSRRAPNRPLRDNAHEVSPRLNVRVSNRSRSVAMMALKMIASTPCADAEPTSLACEIVW